MNRRSSPPVGSARVLFEPGLWDNMRLTWRLLRDPRVAPVLKVFVPIVILLYVISPVDFVPDFLLGLGQLDDFGLMGAALLIAVRLLPRLAPRAVLNEHLYDLGLMRADWAPPAHAYQPAGPVVDATYRAYDGPTNDAQQVRLEQREGSW